MFDNIDVECDFKSWVGDYILIQNQLCHITDWVNSAPASGAEHLFAHEIEKYCKDELPLHGELVALGVIIFGYIHKLDLDKITRLIDKFSVSRSLQHIGVTKEAVVEALLDSLEYGEKKGRHTILNEMNYCRSQWNEVLAELIDKEYIYI